MIATLMLLLAVHSTSDTAAKPAKPARPGKPAPAPSLPALDSVRVVRVWSGHQGERPAVSAETTPMTDRDSVIAGMGDIIVLQVRDLASLESVSACRSADDKEVTGCVPAPIRLYLGRRAIPALPVEATVSLPGQRYGTLQFHLQRSAASDEAWADLIGGQSVNNIYLRSMEVSVGLEGKYPVPTDVIHDRFSFARLRERPFKLWSAVFFFGIALFLYYGYKSDVLRDLGPAPDGGQKPFSLGRCQMAWWFILVVGGFAYIFLVTSSWNTITTATLALLGISAGTFLGAAAVDAGHLSEAKADKESLSARKAELLAEANTLEAQLQAGGTTDAVKAEMQKRLVANQAEQERLVSQTGAVEQAAAPVQSKGFLKDILGDGTGQSFHRLQMAVWSIVLGILFINQVWHRLAMPDFDGTLLGLLGISNGTYLGFKFPESHT
jgi:hypothetical protein